MSMTSRERVLAAVGHQVPDRVPFSMGFGPTPEARVQLDEYLAPRGVTFAQLQRRVEDIRTVGPRYTGPPRREGTDIWGVRRKAVSYGQGSYDEIVESPLARLTDPAQLDDYPWPDPDMWDDGGLADRIREVDPDGHYAIRLGGGNPFETFTWMTGLEESMMRLATSPQFVQRALEHITGFFVARVERALSAAPGMVDLVFTADDLGSQSGPLIGPAMYRDLIMPFHRRLHDCIHAHGARVLYHSDGSVVALLDDLVEAGVDILEAVQVDAAGMDPEVLKQRAGDRLAFHGGVSVQQLLPNATPQEVRQETARLVEVFGRGGGYICAPTHAVQVGTPCDNVVAMIETATGRTVDEMLGD
ncbi:MAG: uroporphyrinogen decarboxylase family protein [Planctomycetota bacterium]